MGEYMSHPQRSAKNMETGDRELLKKYMHMETPPYF